MKIQKGSAIRDLIHTLIYANGLLLKFFEYSYVLWLIIKLHILVFIFTIFFIQIHNSLCHFFTHIWLLGWGLHLFMPFVFHSQLCSAQLLFLVQPFVWNMCQRVPSSWPLNLWGTAPLFMRGFFVWQIVCRPLASLNYC